MLFIESAMQLNQVSTVVCMSGLTDTLSVLAILAALSVATVKLLRSKSSEVSYFLRSDGSIFRQLFEALGTPRPSISSKVLFSILKAGSLY